MRQEDFAADYYITATAALSDTQFAELEQLLTVSFKDEPFLCCVVPEDSEHREFVASWMFSRRLQLFLPNSYCLVRKLDGKVVGHAALSPPSAEGMAPSLWTKIKLGFLWAPFALGYTCFSRLLEGFSHFKKTEDEKDLWSLEAVAVDPSERGKGLGSEFMRALMNKVVPTGQDIYMATQKKGLAEFYSRLGFAVIRQGELPLAETTFPNWFMKTGTIQ
ncbi:MAG: hypothetical protein SGCHY_005456 [Lobulomycetales sp.]